MSRLVDQLKTAERKRRAAQVQDPAAAPAQEPAARANAERPDGEP